MLLTFRVVRVLVTVHYLVSSIIFFAKSLSFTIVLLFIVPTFALIAYKEMGFPSFLNFVSL